MNDKPTCGKCGIVMTPANSTAAPEYFLCDKCAPEYGFTPRQVIEVRANDPEAAKLLASALKWIRRIEERTQDLPPLFLNNCDPKPLRQAIEAYLSRPPRFTA